MHYESIFITTPLLTQEQTKEAAAKFRDFLTGQNSEIVHEEHWGLRKLAYPINKKTTGFYHLIEFKADPELIQRLDLEYRRDERILRFLTVRLDKYGVDYNAKRRRGEIGKRFDESEKEKEKETQAETTKK